MAKKGKEGPQRILDSRPRLFFWLIPVWEAYQKLATCRAPGFSGVSRIPWTAVDAYANRKEICGYHFDRLEHLIEVLDGVYLAHSAESGKMRGKKPGK